MLQSLGIGRLREVVIALSSAPSVRYNQSMAETIVGREIASNHERDEVTAQLLILDAGSQYQKLIDRRVRELGVKSDIASLNAPTELLSKYAAFIISGGPASVTSEDAPVYNSDLFSLGKPILGDCYGHQLIAYHFGGRVGRHERREDGKTQIEVDLASGMFNGLTNKIQTVIMSHGDSVLQMPEGFEVTALSGDIIAAMQNTEQRIYSTQFHPEVTHTENGRAMLANFLFNIAGLENNYHIGNKLEEALHYVKNTAGDRNIVCFVSGGLDSSVTAALLLAAELPGKIKFILVDNGMLREGEVKKVVSTYKKMGIEVGVRNEAERFYNARTVLRDGTQSLPLNQATDPQEIRQIIGDTFIAVRRDYLADIGWSPTNTMLAMGTLRPDLIESGSALASVNTDESGIKIHHNDSDDARELRTKGLLIEPLTELHKDEVRSLAIELGLSDEIVFRQASPGPSGGVQVIAQKSPFRHEDIDTINEQLDVYRSVGVGAAILQIASVGVQGDRRSYSHVVALSTDGLPDNWKYLSSLANEIPRTINGVNRVVHASGEMVNGIVEGITPTLLDHENIKLWRSIDDAARKVLVKFGLDRVSVISEVPIILTAANYGQRGEHTAAIRPFVTEDYMTGEAAIPGINFPIEAYIEILAKVTAINGIKRLFFDLSDKPPAPTQWR